MDRYCRLPREVRLALEQWLCEQNLEKEGITYLKVGEGYVEAECLVGFVVGVPVTEGRRFTVTCLPPEEVFQYDPE